MKFYLFHPPMTITQILQRITNKRTACILTDRPAAIPQLEKLLHLAMEVENQKECPNSEAYTAAKKAFYEVLELLPIADRPFKVRE